jgi:aldehyde dehydrogenase (NAD+)
LYENFGTFYNQTKNGMNTSFIAQEVPADRYKQNQEITRIFALQQANLPSLRKTDAATRRRKLQSLKDWMLLHQQDIRDALYQDFKKSAVEVDATEIYATKKEIEFTIKHLASWMKPKKVATPLALLGTSSRVMYEPKGVCLIMAPWNYPFYLVLTPLVSAIAAGCTAMVKPSEMTPHTAHLISQMAAELLPENEVAVFEGDSQVAESLLTLPFNHIFFTGSPAIGKVVMKAAAEHLTSVTLELGGKSPAIIDESANLKDAAEKLVWGKWLNVGQTCVAPDYLLVQQQVNPALLEAMLETITKYYGSDPAQSPAYARIVNSRHHQRLVNLLQTAVHNGAKVAVGGQSSEADLYLAPTILTEVTDDMEVMQQEIFGPILPIITFGKLEEAIQYINKGEKPLALYLFSQHQETTRQVMENTSSGGVCINDCVIHLANPNLPFGGTNNSGLGSSHGHYGFLAFSHEKAVMRQRVGFTAAKALYPPYTDKVKKMIALTMKWF